MPELVALMGQVLAACFVGGIVIKTVNAQAWR